MTVQIVHDVLAADPTVTSLVSDRITPLERKEYTFPAVVLTDTTLSPVNTLTGWGGSDNSVIQVDAWDTTYTGADALAKACRAAIEAAGHAMLPSTPDNFDPLAQLGGVCRVTYQYSIWS